ncbi:MAG: nucleotidyl transferase AbiEii/AbiGii toxin family protein [Methylophilaceae bacterium]|nr:nucleotidyl transferase AbiEii/AbiGii toxin family protein [Methylophilaceae bacterium]
MDKPSLHFPDGPWKQLLQQTYMLLDKIAADGIQIPKWSMGGGTVLMFHYQHRKSKDIDIFVPDPQFLGYVNPRLGGPAEAMFDEYADGTEYVKLFMPQGEIDFVAATPLTKHPYEEYEVLGRRIMLETPVEIVAKKMWHRGNKATPRDLLDLALIIDKHRSGILENWQIFAKNMEAFVAQCEARKTIMTQAFNTIEKIDFNLSYDDCLERVRKLQAEVS